MKPMTKIKLKAMMIWLGFGLLMLIIRNTGTAPTWLMVTLGLIVMLMTFDVSSQIREFEDRLKELERRIK